MAALGLHCGLRTLASCCKSGLVSSCDAQASHHRLLIVVACGTQVLPAPWIGESSQIRYWTCVSCIGGWILTHCTNREVLKVSFNKFYVGLFSPHLKMWGPWREKPELEIFQSTAVFYSTQSPGTRRTSNMCLFSAMRSWGTHVCLTPACLQGRWGCGNRSACGMDVWGAEVPRVGTESFLEGRSTVSKGFLEEVWCSWNLKDVLSWHRWRKGILQRDQFV